LVRTRGLGNLGKVNSCTAGFVCSLTLSGSRYEERWRSLQKEVRVA
jgi:hypothetical protein